MADVPATDRTIVYYSAYPGTDVQAAEVAAAISDIGWAVETQADPALDATCPLVRVGIGSVKGTLGQVRLGLDGWLTSFSAQLSLGLLAATAVPPEP